SAEASARPTRPPPKMITSARSIFDGPIPFVAATPRGRLTRDSAWGILCANFLGVGHGDRRHTRAEARTGARLAGCAARSGAAILRAQRRRAARRRQPGCGGGARYAQSQRSVTEHRRRRSADELAGKLRRLFERRPAAAFWAWLGAVPASGCDCRSADDST